MENKELLEEVITASLEKLKKEGDSESYSKRVSDVCKLYELKISEERIDEERNSKALQRGEDSEKLIHEAELKKEETRQAFFRVGGDVIKALIQVAATTSWIHAIMNFEQTGVIRSKAFTFIPKPKF